MRIIAVVILTLLVSLVIPFWGWVMIIPFLFSFLFIKKGWKAWWSCFWAVLLLYSVLAALAYGKGSDIIADKMAELFSLPNGMLLIIVQAILFGLLAAVAGLTGQSLRKLFSKA